MSIFENISNSDKLSALNIVKDKLCKEIYINCLKLGIDPDEFDYTSYDMPPDNWSNHQAIPHPFVLKKYCDNLAVVMKKIEEIENA